MAVYLRALYFIAESLDGPRWWDSEASGVGCIENDSILIETEEYAGTHYMVRDKLLQ